MHRCCAAVRLSSWYRSGSVAIGLGRTLVSRYDWQKKIMLGWPEALPVSVMLSCWPLYAAVLSRPLMRHRKGGTARWRRYISSRDVWTRGPSPLSPDCKDLPHCSALLRLTIWSG